MNQKNYLYRMNQWLKERFPPINFVSGFFLYLLAKAVVALDQQQLNITIVDLFGIFIPAMHLFLLRVFDEHKDYDSDRMYYPNRIIQRGIFTLKEVAMLGWIAGAIQIACYIVVRKGWLSDVSFLALWLWTFLMYKEFFMGQWLKKKLMLYGFLHLLVTPLLILSLFSVCIQDFDQIGNWKNFAFPLGISILTGWLYEISRKTKAPDEESGDISYSLLWGVNRSLFVIYFSTLLTVVASLLFFKSLGIFSDYLLLTGFILIVLCRMTTRSFRNQPTAQARKKNEGVTLLISLFAFLPPIVFAFILGN